jgi:chlorite dismutase
MSQNNIVTDIVYWASVSKELGEDFYTAQNDIGSTVKVDPEDYILVHPCVDGKAWYLRKEVKP